MTHPTSEVRFYLLAIAFCLVVVTLPTMGTTAPTHARTTAPRVIRLDVTPVIVHLVGPERTQRLLVTATMADGTQRDVTDQVVFAASDPKRVAVTRDGEVAARMDGTGVVAARWGGKTAKATIQATETGQPLVVSFVDDIVPVLSRLGCSSGACHGAQQGKGGFRLSLRGYAPEIDFISITRQLGGRRISRENPVHSLFLRKPLAEVPHRGGKRFDTDSREYRLLLTWLKQGALGPTGQEAPLTKLEILPGDRQMRPGQIQRLLTRATFADGRVEDVTGRALYAANDVAIATVTEDGQVTMQRSGETAVTAKYMDKLAVVRFVAPYDQKVTDAAYRARNNTIDDLVNAKLKQLHIEPSGLCTDEEFLRRVTIDAIGTLPTADEARAFLNDKDPQKRDKLVDTLLQRPEYGMVWALKFGDLFVLRREYMHRKYAMLLQQWLMEQFNANRPWDKMVTDLLTASGDLDQNRAGYFFVSRTPQKEGENYWVRAPQVTGEMTAQVFLGSRIQCAKCHNHPTERYTQDDYYHYTALWQQVTGKGDNDDGVPQTLAATAGGDVRQPRTGEVMSPRPLDRADLHYAKDEDRRVKAATWLVNRDEFARAIVNRYWARCFGSGIVEPVDDIRSTNPAKNEPLMRFLCDDLRQHHYDLKYLLGTILKSRTYQLSAHTNRTNKIDIRLYSHYMPRRMPAEELADAVAQVTGVPDRYNGLAPGTRACELADTEIPSIMLDTFGRPPRVQSSDGERNCNPAISQALALLNGNEIQQKLKSGDCVISTLLKSSKPDAELLDTLFLSTLARHPAPEESKALLTMIAQAPKHEEGLQDALWALLNSKEFLFNH
jgi:hypothetical protein